MKKIYVVIALFVILFISGMAYFMVTIDKSFNQKEKILINTQQKTETETFKEGYFIKVNQTDTLTTVS